MKRNRIQSLSPIVSSMFKLLICLILTLLLTSCLDDIDFGDGFMSSGSYNYQLDFSDIDPGIGLMIDSAIQIEAHSATLLFKVIPFNQDSIVVLKGIRVTIWQKDSLTHKAHIRKFMPGPDTVDFRKTNPYLFQLRIDSLLKETHYTFYASRGYSSIAKSDIDSTSCISKNNGCEWVVYTKK